MNRDMDIALAKRFEREAEEDEHKATDAEKSVRGYNKEDQQLFREYVTARMDVARFARKLARLLRDRAEQD